MALRADDKLLTSSWSLGTIIPSTVPLRCRAACGVTTYAAGRPAAGWEGTKEAATTGARGAGGLVREEPFHRLPGAQPHGTGSGRAGSARRSMPCCYMLVASVLGAVRRIVYK